MQVIHIDSKDIQLSDGTDGLKLAVSKTITLDLKNPFEGPAILVFALDLDQETKSFLFNASFQVRNSATPSLVYSRAAGLLLSSSVAATPAGVFCCYPQSVTARLLLTTSCILLSRVVYMKTTQSWSTPHWTISLRSSTCETSRMTGMTCAAGHSEAFWGPSCV